MQYASSELFSSKRKKNEVWLLLLRSDTTLDFHFFRLFDCVKRVDGVVLDSSSVSEGREKEDIFCIL